MLQFDFYAPTRIAFGKGTVSRVGELVKEYGGKRVLIHYGGQSAIRSGLIDQVKRSLDEAGIAHWELGIHPTEEQILAMAESCARAAGRLQGSAKPLGVQDMTAIYRAAL